MPRRLPRMACASSRSPRRRSRSRPSRAYDGLTFLGLVGFRDPPRPEVKDAIAACRRAGIRVVMVTGDHAVTARKIAEILGIVEPRQRHPGRGARPEAPRRSCARKSATALLAAQVFARVTPAQKLDLVTLYQSAGEVVAMTGDGVNDAPALQKADIGVAMGLRGTEVAREAAAIVLRDDAFGSIVAAIREGRVIFNNLRRFLVYLLVLQHQRGDGRGAWPCWPACPCRSFPCRFSFSISSPTSFPPSRSPPAKVKRTSCAARRAIRASLCSGDRNGCSLRAAPRSSPRRRSPRSSSAAMARA